MKRLTVNLAPADLRKARPAYDLPIGIGLLLASERLREALEVTKIYSVSGMLPADTPRIRLRPFCAPHRRASGTVTFLANFSLIASMNPCPCGYFQDPEKSCTCSPSVIARYQKHISGPLLDGIDIHVEVPRVNYEKLAGERLREPSSAIREQVAARTRQAVGAKPSTTLSIAPSKPFATMRMDDRTPSKRSTKAGQTAAILISSI